MRCAHYQVNAFWKALAFPDARQRIFSRGFPDDQRTKWKEIWPIFWPSNSPDLTPVENKWNLKNDFIQSKNPDLGNGKLGIQNQLRDIVREAWDFKAVDDEKISLLVCQPDVGLLC